MGRRKIALDPAEVERLAAQGLAEYQIAEALGISQDTLDRRKQDAADIAEALQRGQRGARGEIENAAGRERDFDGLPLACLAHPVDETVRDTVLPFDDTSLRRYVPASSSPDH